MRQAQVSTASLRRTRKSALAYRFEAGEDLMTIEIGETVAVRRPEPRRVTVMPGLPGDTSWPAIVGIMRAITTITTTMRFRRRWRISSPLDPART